MQGNTFIVVPHSERNTQIPLKLANRLGWSETDPETGEVVSYTRPTWQQVGMKYRQAFGEIRVKDWNAVRYYVLELELSFLKGEVQALIQLQQSGQLKFIIMTRSEAEAWLDRDEDVFR